MKRKCQKLPKKTRLWRRLSCELAPRWQRGARSKHASCTRGLLLLLFCDGAGHKQSAHGVPISQGVYVSSLSQALAVLSKCFRENRHGLIEASSTGSVCHVAKKRVRRFQLCLEQTYWSEGGRKKHLHDSPNGQKWLHQRHLKEIDVPSILINTAINHAVLLVAETNCLFQSPRLHFRVKSNKISASEGKKTSELTPRDVFLKIYVLYHSFNVCAVEHETYKRVKKQRDANAPI